jgi:dTDP-4-dehydrorhamnose reductase
MRILITGANGFVAYYLIKLLLEHDNIAIIATGKGSCRLPFKQQNFIYESLDFTDVSDTNKIVSKHMPTHIIHAGAISKPDDCENNKPLAYKINVEGTKILLAAAQNIKASFLLVSTDFVFDGKVGFCKETDTTKAVNYYGQTKIEAEKLVKQYTYQWSIVRIALVYGKPQFGRNNIVTLVKEKLNNKEEYKVFSDQLRTPTYVEDVAVGIFLMLQKNAYGIYHIAGQDILSPYEIAIATAKYLDLDDFLIKNITSKDLVQPALRPAITNFNIDKAKEELGYKPNSFIDGLKKTMEK